MLGSGRRGETSRWRASDGDRSRRGRGRALRPRATIAAVATALPLALRLSAVGASSEASAATLDGLVFLLVAGSSSSSGSRRSEAWRKALFSSPMSTKAAWMPGRTASTRPEIDVADGAAMIRPVHQQLDQTVVLEDGHAGLPLAPVDQNLALHAGTSTARADCPRWPAGD